MLKFQRLKKKTNMPISNQEIIDYEMNIILSSTKEDLDKIIVHAQKAQKVGLFHVQR